MSRILGLDVGERRIGVAVSDALNLTAQGLDTIKRQDVQNTVKQIRSLIKEYNISKLVVGMPFNMNGTKGFRARRTEEFVSLLKKNIPITVEIVDERLTTVQGERLLLESNVSRTKRKLHIDKISAKIILQVYLDSNVSKD